MTYLNALVSMIAVIGLVTSAIGWRHSLATWNPREPEWWFSVAKVWYAAAIGLRLFGWDVVWGIWFKKNPEAAAAFSIQYGVTNVNIITGVMVCFGVYSSLKARHLLIPLPERDEWHWYNAWMHPKWGVVWRPTWRATRRKKHD